MAKLILRALFISLVVAFAAGIRRGAHHHGRRSINQRVMEGIMKNLEAHKPAPNATQSVTSTPVKEATPVAALQGQAHAVVTKSAVHQVRKAKATMTTVQSKSTDQKKTHKVGTRHRGPKKRVIQSKARKTNLASSHQSYRRVDLKHQAKRIEEEVRRIKADRAKKASNEAKMPAMSRKAMVDKIWKPTPMHTRKVVKQSVEKETTDPFASMSNDFVAARNLEMKKVSLLKNKPAPETEVSSGDVTKAAEEDLAKAEKSVEAIAGADDVSKSTKEDLKSESKDPFSGLKSMEADAEGIAEAADQDAQDEAKEKGAAEKVAKQANEKLVEDAETLGAKTEEAPKKPAPQKPKHTVETLAEAERRAKAAQNMAAFSKVGEGLAKVWSDGGNDSKRLNSELAENVALNNKLAQERLEKVESFEDNKKADAIDQLDKQWQQQFPTAPSAKSTEAVVKPHAKLAPPEKKIAKPVSEWGTLANNLAVSNMA